MMAAMAISCRAHFYLETLRNLPLGAADPVLDELLKPSVAKAPFEGTRRIGHVALEILIDRAGQEPGDVWQNLILNLAGDPRISSTAANYREWWQPLGGGAHSERCVAGCRKKTCGCSWRRWSNTE